MPPKRQSVLAPRKDCERSSQTDVPRTISCSSVARRAEGSPRPCTPPGCRPNGRASLRRARTASEARKQTFLAPSAVAPSLGGRRDRPALVLHRDAAQTAERPCAAQGLRAKLANRRSSHHQL